MRVLILALMSIVAMSPAFAQLERATAIPLQSEGKVYTPEEKEKQKATEDAYKAAIKRIPDAKPADPWGNMRGADTQTSQAKTKQTQKKQ